MLPAGQSGCDPASGQVFCDRNGCLPAEFFHNYFLSPPCDPVAHVAPDIPSCHGSQHPSAAPRFPLHTAETGPAALATTFDLNCQVPINSSLAWGNSSISLDGFISPADSKPHWEAF